MNTIKRKIKRKKGFKYQFRIILATTLSLLVIVYGFRLISKSYSKFNTESIKSETPFHTMGSTWETKIVEGSKTSDGNNATEQSEITPDVNEESKSTQKLEPTDSTAVNNAGNSDAVGNSDAAGNTVDSDAGNTVDSDAGNTNTDGNPDAADKSEKAENPDSDEKLKTAIPDGFVYLKDYLPDARFEVRYATTHNFTGQVVEGYLSDNVSLTKEAATALKNASDDLKSQGYGILIYDAYRPKRAVDFFIEWGKQPENNLTKDEFYPDFSKEYLFNNGYLARRSGHSRGSTIDLTIFYLSTGELVDMGSPYDFLGTISNHGTNKITETQTNNRNILKIAMKKANFKELRTEWWHYELIDEPYPDTYFDFIIE